LQREQRERETPRAGGSAQVEQVVGNVMFRSGYGTWSWPHFGDGFDPWVFALEKVVESMSAVEIEGVNSGAMVDSLCGDVATASAWW